MAAALAGRLIGIARRAGRRQPMETLCEALVSVEAGIEGCSKGAKFPKRQVTILAVEDWRAALGDLGPDGADLDWMVRRANLLVEGLRLPRAKGARITVGDVELEITGQTVPCGRMDEARMGLRKALHPEWRGGVTARVIAGGRLVFGSAVAISHAPAEAKARLP